MEMSEVSESRDDSNRSETPVTEPGERFVMPNVEIRGRAMRGEGDDDTSEAAEALGEPRRIGGADGGAAEYRIAPALLPQSYTLIRDGPCFICRHPSAKNMIQGINVLIIEHILEHRAFSDCCSVAVDEWNAFVGRCAPSYVAHYDLTTITQSQGSRHAYLCPTEEIITLARTEELNNAMLCERIRTASLYRLANGATVIAPEANQILQWQRQLQVLRQQKEKQCDVWRDTFTSVINHLPRG